jgi:hypothetical protein
MPDITSSDIASERQPERRQNLVVREIFERAYALIEPFFGWGGQPLEYLAFQRLCDSFPDLSHENVHIIVSAAQRVYRERHPDAA